MGAPVAGSSRIKISDAFTHGGGSIGLIDCPAHGRLTPETLLPCGALALGGLGQARRRLARLSLLALGAAQRLYVGRDVSLHGFIELLGSGSHGRRGQFGQLCRNLRPNLLRARHLDGPSGELRRDLCRGRRGEHLGIRHTPRDLWRYLGRLRD
ncbi:MAG: hypothetical protein M3460_15810 [Actinomycetota bacterium]|nr:hypothetical protein [Actinomycetota bacterium]